MNALSIPRPPRVRLPIAFIVVALLMYVIDGVIVHSPKFLLRPDLLAAAASFDLTIGVTATYWFIVVRRGHASKQSMLRVFVLSVVAATLTMPPGHRDLVRYIRYLGIPFEIAVVALIVVGVRRTRRSLAAAGSELDIPERIRLVLGGAGMQPTMADVFATETSMFYFALASWRRKPFVPSNASGFAYHTKNSYAAMLYTLVPITLVESVAVDLIVRVHHPLTANVLLAVDLIAAVWLLGLARGVQLRPILVTPNDIQVRNGLQWRLDIPRSAIARVDFGKVSVPPKRTAGYLRAAPGRSNVLIELSEPLRAHGPYGITREVKRVGLSVDDLVGFQRAVATD